MNTVDRLLYATTEILAAVLSCAYSYEMIAKNIVKNNPDSINHDFMVNGSKDTFPMNMQKKMLL